MKSAINGALQVSVLDGWWAEAYDGDNGWSLPGDVDHDHDAQDTRDAVALHRVFDDEVLPTFYDREPADCRWPGWPGCGRRCARSPAILRDAHARGVRFGPYPKPS